AEHGEVCSMKIIHESKIQYCRQRAIATRAELADRFWSRLRGLMFRNSFGDADAVILDRCRSIHTFFVKFSIDVVCLDYSDEITGLFESLRPGKIFMPRNQTSTIVELPPGTIKIFSIEPGDSLILRN
ncbi:MAG: DUF192 domain-containing protein, partial [bacterium]